MPPRTGSSARIQALYNDSDVIIIKRKPYIKKLVNFYRHSAAYNHLESFTYGPISHMLVTYAETCEHADPDAAVCFVPQGCFEAVLGIPSESNTERRRRRFSDGYLTLSHNQTARVGEVGYISPSVGSWVEAKAVRGVKDFFGARAKAYADHEIASDIAQVCEQAFFAMLHSKGDVFYAVVFYGARFFCFKFTRPADWDNIREKYRGKPFSAEFNAVDYPIPETMYSNELIFLKDLSDLSPMWKDTMGLMTSGLHVSHQRSWFQPPQGYRRGKPKLTAANKAIATFKDSIEEKAAPEDMSLADTTATATPTPGSAYDPSSASLRAIAKLPRCNFDLRNAPRLAEALAGPASIGRVLTGEVPPADGVTGAPDDEVRRRQPRRVLDAAVEPGTQEPAQLGQGEPHPGRLHLAGITRSSVQAPQLPGALKDTHVSEARLHSQDPSYVAQASASRNSYGRPAVSGSRPSLLAGSASNAGVQAVAGAPTGPQHRPVAQLAAVNAPPSRRLPRHVIHGPSGANDPPRRPNVAPGHRLHSSTITFPASSQPGLSRIAEAAPAPTVTENPDPPRLSRAAHTQSTSGPSSALPIGLDSAHTDSAGVSHTDNQNVRRAPKRARPASVGPHEDDTADPGAGHDGPSPAGPSKRPRIASRAVSGPTATGTTRSRAAPAANNATTTSGPTFAASGAMRGRALATHASSRGPDVRALGRGGPAGRSQPG